MKFQAGYFLKRLKGCINGLNSIHSFEKTFPSQVVAKSQEMSEAFFLFLS